MTQEKPSQRKRSKSNQRDRKPKEQTPKLSPFSTKLSQMEKEQQGPWTNSTPHAKTARLLPEPPAAPPAASSSTSSGPTDSDLRQQIANLLQTEGTNLSGGLRQALTKMTAEAPVSELKHAHLSKLQNAQRSIQKLQERKEVMDKEWLQFQQQMTEKFNRQKEAYLTIRKQLVESIAEKQSTYNQAVQEIKNRTPQEATNKLDGSQVIDLENSPPPWAIPVLDSTEMDLTLPESPVRKIRKQEQDAKIKEKMECQNEGES